MCVKAIAEEYRTTEKVMHNAVRWFQLIKKMQDFEVIDKVYEREIKKLGFLNSIEE